ncbi:MAG: aldo/keto reductase [Candidatus Dormibacter sp.]
MSDFGFGPLSYGAANVGNLYRPLTDDQAQAVLETAWQTGIRYFDTAPHYGLGLSELRVGHFLATKPRDQFIVSTKVGRLLRPNPEGLGRLDAANDFAVPADLKRVWDFSADGIRRSLDESLARLGLDSVDILYLHDPEKYDLTLGISAGIPALAALRDEGLVSAIGVGSMSVAALLESVRSDALDLLMVAGRFTLVEQPALAEVIPECRRKGIGVVNSSVFNSGLLASNNLGTHSRYEYGEVPPQLLARTKDIAGVCAQYDVELPAAALQYTLRERAVRTVVVGASTSEQIQQNAERMMVTIPDDMWRTLAAKGLIAE